jgi:hypothetical protein
VKKSAKQDDPWQTALRTRRESIEPPLERGDLAALKRALAVVANELRGAPMVTGLLEMMDRAIHIASRGGALGMPAMELDDLGGGE